MTAVHNLDALDQAAMRATALAGVRAMLILVGEDPDRAGLSDTPRRVVDAFLEMTDRPGDPAALLACTFDDVGQVRELVTVGPVPFTSLCEHHLLPFTGHAWIAYLPASHRVVGLSKFARLVDHYARRVQVQERLTEDIAAAIEQHARPFGVGVRLVAEHMCMTVRGVTKPGAAMTTTALRGDLCADPYRKDFLASVHTG